MAMTYTHRREEWEEAAYPFSGPAFNWGGVDLIVIHYPGGGSGIADGDPNDPTPKAQMRAMQRDYVKNRGYSLGYSVVVDYRGESWEARGDRFRCAANKYVNARSFAIQLMVDRDDRGTPAQVAEVNRLIRQAAEHIGPEAKVVGHYQTTMPPYGPLSSPGTSCPGAGIKAQLATGEIGLHVKPPAPKPDPKPNPKPSDGTLLAHGWYRVNAGEYPYAVARKLFGGTGKANEIAARNPGTWKPGQFVEIPDTPTVVVTVKPGEGALAAIRRALPGENPQTRLEAFYVWNGGRDRMLHAGDVVSVPVHWRPR